MSTERPRLSVVDAVEIALSVYGVPAASARDLGSDRDRTFAILRTDGCSIAVLKVSNRWEDPAVLDMEAEAALHIMGEDPGLRVALPWRARRDAGPARPGDRPEDLRARWWHGDVAHWVRLYHVLPGHSRIDAHDFSDAALEAWGMTAARLTRALRGFSHPCARRPMPWNVQNALSARAMLDDVWDADVRAAVAGVLDAYERHAAPIWPALRAQVVHADLTVENALSDDDGFITGIIFLVIAPYNQNKFVRFHAFQAIFGHLALVVLWILFLIVNTMLAFLTHGLAFLLYPLVMIGVVVLWLYLMYSAYNNKRVKLPVIGDLAEKQA